MSQVYFYLTPQVTPTDQGSKRSVGVDDLSRGPRESRGAQAEPA